MTHPTPQNPAGQGNEQPRVIPLTSHRWADQVMPPSHGPAGDKNTSGPAAAAPAASGEPAPGVRAGWTAAASAGHPGAPTGQSAMSFATPGAPTGQPATPFSPAQQAWAQEPPAQAAPFSPAEVQPAASFSPAAGPVSFEPLRDQPKPRVRRALRGVGIFALLVVALAVNAAVLQGAVAGLTGSGGTSAPWETSWEPSDPRAQAEGPFVPLELTQTGWYADADGGTQVVVVVSNPNEHAEAQLPEVKVTGKDDQGRILFSESVYVGTVLAQSQGATCSYVGYDKPAPASVEFSVSMPDYGWLDNAQTADETYRIGQTRLVTSDSVGSDLTGQIEFVGDLGDAEYCEVVAVLKDDSGAVVGGASDLVDVAPGGAQSFSIWLYGLPEFSTYELYAMPW